MEQPPRFLAKASLGRCANWRSPYMGLKQTLRAWFWWLVLVVEEFGLSRTQKDSLVLFH